MEKLKSFTKAKWNASHTSLWFIPSILVSTVVVLSFVVLWADRQYEELIQNTIPWLFGGSPSAARSLLSTIAASVITVVSVSFSLTIIAMQQASSQYTPRVLRTFTTDRVNQTVLGSYLATFVYSLLILRAVREPDGNTPSFVPSISSSIAIVFVLICIGLLIYFISHIATSLQATTIISRVHRQLLQQINRLYPRDINSSIKKPLRNRSTNKKDKKIEIKAKKGGFVTYIDEDSLINMDLMRAKALHILPKVGDFVAQGEVIIEIIAIKEVTEELSNKISDTITIENQRSITEDPLYSIRQLVDTALKGLSPGINDTTTADYSIRFLGDALGVLASKEFPDDIQNLKKGNTLLYLNKPNWDEFVIGSFDQIILNATDKIQVLVVILLTLERLADQLPDNERAAPVKQLLDNVQVLVRTKDYLPNDKRKLKEHIRSARKAIDRH